ncbi:putative acid proteinase, partial [Cladorrhinum sp. PSN332]
MKSSSTYLATALGLFTLSLATPTSLPPKLPTRSSPGAGQLRLLHTSTPSTPSSRIASSRIGFTSTSTSREEESTKGGALLSLSPSSQNNNTLTSVTATFQIPQAKMPTRGPTANQTLGLYAASFHIGIDSVSGTCSSFLRAGVDIFRDGSLDEDLQDPQAWYQFGPNDPVGFGNFSVAEGELVRVTVGVTEVKIENFGANVTCARGLAPKQVASAKIDAKGSLCAREVAWTVEDFPLAGLPGIPVALADFGAVRFRDVGVLGSETKNATGAVVSDVRLAAQGGRLTSCLVTGEGGEVRCDRV